MSGSPNTGRYGSQDRGRLGGPYQIVRRVAAVESVPTDPRVCITGGNAADCEWMIFVVNALGVRVNGRTYTVTFGRRASCLDRNRNRTDGTPDRAPDVDVLTIDEVVSVPASTDLPYLQPTFGDDLWCAVTSVGTVDTAGGERIVVAHKLTDRNS